MFDIFKKIFAVLILVFVSACSSVKQDPSTKVVSESTVITIDGDDDFYNYLESDDFCDDGCDVIEIDEEEEDVVVEEDHFKTIPYYDSKLLYKQLENQVKKVEIKKIIVKPVFSTNTDPVELSLEEVKDVVDNISSEDEFEDGVEYDNKSIMVLIDNYKNILKASYSCCVANIVDGLKNYNVSQESILDYLSLDADEYAVQNMCLVVNNKDVKDAYDNNFLTSVISKVRSDCICNNAKFIRKNLNNFYKLYNEKPELYDEVLVYRFKDKNGRVVEQNINETVLNISNVLYECAK